MPLWQHCYHKRKEQRVGTVHIFQWSLWEIENAFLWKANAFCSIISRHWYSSTSMCTLASKYFTRFLLPNMSETAATPFYPTWNYKENSHVLGDNCMLNWPVACHKTMNRDCGLHFLVPTSHPHWCVQLSKWKFWYSTIEF